MPPEASDASAWLPVLEGRDKVYDHACGNDFQTYTVIVRPSELALCAREV